MWKNKHRYSREHAKEKNANFWTLLLQQQCGRKQKHSIPSMSSGVACDC